MLRFILYCQEMPMSTTPNPLSRFKSVADLIDDCHRRESLGDLEGIEWDALKHVLRKLGRVARGPDTEWFMMGPFVAHPYFTPESPRPLDKDGQRIIHQDAANIRVQPLLEDFKDQ
jgi:hypothetical protein